MKRSYTKKEDFFLRKNYSSTRHAFLARRLHRSVISIRKRGAKLGLSKPLRRWTSREDRLLKRCFRKIPLIEFAKKINRSDVEVSTRRKQLGLGSWKRKPKGTHAGRPILGFLKGQPVYTHRHEVEKYLGRKLKPFEVVHHLNFDKWNNKITNLIVLSRSQHRKLHMSFEHLVPTLLERKIIGFNRANLEYFVKLL